MSILNKHRSIAEAKLLEASDPEVVKDAILKMEENLKKDMPTKTCDALDFTSLVNPNSVQNLIWALRSTRLLEFRQEPDSKKSDGREVGFERRLVREAGKDSGWANQIVVWSGLASFKRADIDLGFQESACSFEMYELKLNTAAGAQHRAIVALASYAIGYLFGRTLFSNWKRPDVQEELQKLHKHNTLEDKEKSYLKKGRLLQTPECELLNATQLKWILVAPKAYFAGSHESREKSQILKEGFDLYLADVQSRPGFGDLRMGCSVREMEFKSGKWESEPSLANTVQAATARSA